MSPQPAGRFGWSCSRSVPASQQKEGQFTVTQTAEPIYRSSNGDRWTLIRDAHSGRMFVRHEANLPSGGRITDTDVDEFLCVAGSGPEYAVLRHILDRAIDP